MNMHDALWKITNQISHRTNKIKHNAQLVKDYLEWMKEDVPIPIDDDEKVSRIYETMMRNLNEIIEQSDLYHTELS